MSLVTDKINKINSRNIQILKNHFLYWGDFYCSLLFPPYGKSATVIGKNSVALFKVFNVKVLISYQSVIFKQMGFWNDENKTVEIPTTFVCLNRLLENKKATFEQLSHIGILGAYELTVYDNEFKNNVLIDSFYNQWNYNNKNKSYDLKTDGIEQVYLNILKS